MACKYDCMALLYGFGQYRAFVHTGEMFCFVDVLMCSEHVLECKGRGFLVAGLLGPTVIFQCLFITHYLISLLLTISLSLIYSSCLRLQRCCMVFTMVDII